MRSGCASLYTAHSVSLGHQTSALGGTCLGRVGVRVRVGVGGGVGVGVGVRVRVGVGVRVRVRG